jgi:hypothetical protein
VPHRSETHVKPGGEASARNAPTPSALSQESAHTVSAGPEVALGRQVEEDETNVVPFGHVEQRTLPGREYEPWGQESGAVEFRNRYETSVGVSAKSKTRTSSTAPANVHEVSEVTPFHPMLIGPANVYIHPILLTEVMMPSTKTDAVQPEKVAATWRQVPLQTGLIGAP